MLLPCRRLLHVRPVTNIFRFARILNEFLSNLWDVTTTTNYRSKDGDRSYDASAAAIVRHSL